MNRVRGRLGNVSMASEKILFSRPKVELAEAEASAAATHADAAAPTAATTAAVAAAAESTSRPADTSAGSAPAKPHSEVCNVCASFRLSLRTFLLTCVFQTPSL